MHRFNFKALAVAGAVAISVLAVAPQQAEARRALPLIAGIAIGAVAAGIIANSRRGHAYYAEPYAYRAPSPGSRAWHDYCSARYRSFDPYSGTYQPYHGPRRPCR